MKKMLFIYNPNAGTGLLKPKLSDVLDIFVKGGYEVTVYPTQRYHDALSKTISYEGDYDLVVCSGGDGTLDEVVTGMSKRDRQVPVGYIPAGTTNDLPTACISQKICWRRRILQLTGFRFHAMWGFLMMISLSILPRLVYLQMYPTRQSRV